MTAGSVAGLPEAVLALARIVGLLGVFLNVGGYIALALLEPCVSLEGCQGPEPVPGAAFDAVVLSGFFALVATWGVLKARALFLFFAFLGAFVWSGWYFVLLLSPSATWIGLGVFFYLVSGMLVIIRTQFLEMWRDEAF